MMSPRDHEQALAWLKDQSRDPDQSWDGMCQKLARSSYGIGGGFASAWLQWLGADPDDKHPGGRPADAPLGAALFWKGSSPYGHVAIRARSRGDGAPMIWSNDLIRRGHVDYCLATLPTTRWGQRYLGYTTALNDVDLRLATKAKVKRRSRYKALGAALERIEDALDVARRLGDGPDIRVLSTERDRLRKIHGRLRKGR